MNFTHNRQREGFAFVHTYIYIYQMTIHGCVQLVKCSTDRPTELHLSDRGLTGNGGNGPLNLM